MSAVEVLMVAEKPSIAQVLASALSDGNAVQKRRGVSPSSPIYEYDGTFQGVPAHFKVTATTGHVFSLDFSESCNDWTTTAPIDLFHAETVRLYDPRGRIPEHLHQEAKGIEILVLWLDCDREGENICFEVMGEVLPNMVRRRDWPDAYEGCVYRAHFSSLAAVDLQEAMTNLGHPDIRQAHSVDARQEIDLRLGVAFSRFQTVYFRKHFGNQLGRKMVTYGPCQFPTLWFCVKRHCEIEAFVPLPFWQIKLVTDFGDDNTFECNWQGGRCWNQQEADAVTAILLGSTQAARVESVRSWSSHIPRPLPMNTLAMLKMASDELGIGPGDAMHLAEQLYLKGVLSYPRTETDKYPENFDIAGTVQKISNPDASWNGYSQHITCNGYNPPRTDGNDVGDHPPITPVKFATQSQCGGQPGWYLYCAICKHFLASISPDCALMEGEVIVEMSSQRFSAKSVRVINKGWCSIDERQVDGSGSIDLGTCRGWEGRTLPVKRVELVESATKPPGHLSESELLALMERYGIGTDASMAVHVSNVQNRAYVILDPTTRQMVPSALGLALANAYALIDPALLLPTVRSRIENACSNVSKGLEQKEGVIRRTIRTFERKMHNFALRIDRLPLMLAVAYARERGSDLVAGDAAGQGLKMWEEAKQIHNNISLQQLFEEKDLVVLDSQTGDMPEPSEAQKLIEEKTDAVMRVQEALEQLGFGSPDVPQQKPNKNQGKAKEKSKQCSDPEAGQVPSKTGQGVNRGVGQNLPPSSIWPQIEVVIRNNGGSIDFAILSRQFQGLKKKDLASYGGVKVVDRPRCPTIVWLKDCHHNRERKHDQGLGGGVDQHQLSATASHTGAAGHAQGNTTASVGPHTGSMAGTMVGGGCFPQGFSNFAGCPQGPQLSEMQGAGTHGYQPGCYYYLPQPNPPFSSAQPFVGHFSGCPLNLVGSSAPNVQPNAQQFGQPNYWHLQAPTQHHAPANSTVEGSQGWNRGAGRGTNHNGSSDGGCSGGGRSGGGRRGGGHNGGGKGRNRRG